MNNTIGIITFHCSYNYGSVLQAYAPQQYLFNKGYYPQLIHYYSEGFIQYKIKNAKADGIPSYGYLTPGDDRSIRA